FVLFPIQYPKIWSMHKIAESTFWMTEDIPLDGDLLHWKQHLNDLQCFFIICRLTFLARSNDIVNPEPAKQFCCKVQIMEALSFYGFPTMIQNIHSKTYSLLIKT
ncbi:ribonucleotide reductase small subunit, partial [Pisolithus orientalis]|uniref:ribonucleotide reductase small subunit n=1 Tax=Pisolithus orientalis TaxID=936130 RepID=UPI002224E9A5